MPTIIYDIEVRRHGSSRWWFFDFRDTRTEANARADRLRLTKADSFAGVRVREGVLA